MSKNIVLLPTYIEDEQVDTLRSHLSEEVETTNQAYDALFARCGSWASWISHIAVGRDYLSQQPIYSRFFCITETLGKANAEIINQALEAGKECYFFDGKEKYSIMSVYRHSDDWSNGWKISYM